MQVIGLAPHDVRSGLEPHDVRSGLEPHDVRSGLETHDMRSDPRAYAVACSSMRPGTKRESSAGV